MWYLKKIFSRAYRVQHHRFFVEAEDGVQIAGIHLERREERTINQKTLIIYIHGFMGSKNNLRVPDFLENLSEHVDVMAIDMRGHGESGGYTTIGAHEVLDIQATIDYARSLGYYDIVTLGSSTGGTSAIRHAGLYKSQQGVITLGAFADQTNIGRWISDDGLRIVYRAGRIGKLWCYLTGGTRLHDSYNLLMEQEPAYKLVGKIAPIPLLLQHGTLDWMVHPRAATLLFENANEPKELVIIPRGGHDHPNLNQKTIKRIMDWMERHGLADRAQVSEQQAQMKRMVPAGHDMTGSLRLVP